jgi:hypothetical protein
VPQRCRPHKQMRNIRRWLQRTHLGLWGGTELFLDGGWLADSNRSASHPGRRSYCVQQRRLCTYDRRSAYFVRNDSSEYRRQQSLLWRSACAHLRVDPGEFAKRAFIARSQSQPVSACDGARKLFCEHRGFGRRSTVLLDRDGPGRPVDDFNRHPDRDDCGRRCRGVCRRRRRSNPGADCRSRRDCRGRSGKRLLC